MTREDAADEFARICRARGIASTKSPAAQDLALFMAMEAFGDSALTRILEGVENIEGLLHDLHFSPHSPEEVPEIIEAVEEQAQYLVGLAETLRDEFLDRLPRS